MDARYAIRMPKSQNRADAGAEVPPLRHEARVPQLSHQSSPQLRDPKCVHPGLRRPVRKTESGQRRRHDIESVVSQHRNNLQHLQERSWPTVGDDQRHSLSASCASMQKMNPGVATHVSVMLPRRQLLNLRFPIEPLAPIGANLTQVCKIRAALPGRSGNLIRPACLLQPPAQIAHGSLGIGQLKLLDRHEFILGPGCDLIGHMGKLLQGLAFVACLHAATPASFDNPRAAWKVLHGTAAPDPSVTHEGQMSMRLESGGAVRDARVQSAPIALTIGKSYELTGWIRTDQLAVRDLDRSPIATGAALSMASLPFDVQSESLGGTRDWTSVHLRFTATRAQDNIVLTVAYGGTFEGKAWFSGASIDEAAPSDSWPTPAAVTTYGPAYRYPAGGWVYLHIEGQPYERGYQHGHLMAKEIPQYMERCAAELDPKGKDKSWNLARTTATALFLHGFDQEILQEMKGIADGASDAGARWQGRAIDLTDIMVVNTTVELGELSSALTVTPNGLEGLRLAAPNYLNRKRSTAQDHCSAFAATGAATRDGRMVIGHTTWWPLTLAEQTNVMIDIKPVTGHRVLMQSYPGGIESGTDWYQNDAGVVLTETTINQSPFNINGTPIAYRARKAIQYGENIDQVVQYLTEKNNGLYTNEWLLGDAKTNEVALFELGTYKTRLYRSSKNDWFGGTEGFYWGDNNAKDLGVRLEENPDPNGATTYVPYVPTDRDLKWQGR